MGKLTDKINSLNELGRVNLAEKGVVLDENATTYEIMEGISHISQKEEVDYIEVIPEVTITTSSPTTIGWFYGMTQFFEQLQEIDVTKDYRLTIDKKIIDCTFSKRPSEFDDYECGNGAPVSGNDTGEDYYFMIRTGVALYLYIKEETANQHTIKLEVAASYTKSYADKIYEYYNIDKLTYPYLTVGVLSDKTRIYFSAEPLDTTESKAYSHYTISKTKGLEDETDAGVVFGWIKGCVVSIPSLTDANYHLPNGVFFANYPIEETDTIKYYPL